MPIYAIIKTKLNVTYLTTFLVKTDFQHNLIETILESDIQDTDGSQQPGHSSLPTPSPFIRHHLQIS
jgi:hypothetical protein